MKKLVLSSLLCAGMFLPTAAQKVIPAIPSDLQLETDIAAWLQKMTLDEKIGQMCEITIDVITDFPGSVVTGCKLSDAMLDTVIGKYKVGFILNVPLSVAQKKEK